MFAVRVLPVARGIFKDELTFFSRAPLEEGLVIEATVRGRKIPAIVLSSVDAREEKSELRSADFALKKLENPRGRRVFLQSFIRAVKDTALFTGVHESVAASALTSAVILGAAKNLVEASAPKHTDPAVVPDLLVLQAEYEERVRTYRNLAREAFARNASVILIAPTVVEAERLSEELSRGIEDRAVLLTGEMPKKKLISAWNKIAGGTEPVVVVGTPLALSAPRSDADTIIVERESAKSYRSLRRPYLDARRTAEYLSRAGGARHILADFPVRAETRYRISANEAGELSRLQARASEGAGTIIRDTRKSDETRGEKRVFTTLAPETKETLKRESAKGGRSFVFAARRGLAPLTVCNDCGTPVTDKATGTPMVLHKTEKGNVFISHRSGAILPAEIACTVCGGWNLVTLGIGVDRVRDELAKEISAPIILFTKESAPTHKAALKLAKEFSETDGAIIVGTERMLPYLPKSDFGAVASIDSMLSLPAWRAHEQALSILFYLRERSEGLLVVETREPDHAVMQALKSGGPSEFFRAEIAERERYSYPPFSVFVGLTAYGSKNEIEKLSERIANTFKDDDLVGPLPAQGEPRGMWSAKAVVRIPRGKWPDTEIAEKIKALPPSIAVAIDPDEIV